MKTFVMGDIHGNNIGLLQCLQRADFNFEEDTLIQLGDVADGWSEVSECVDTLLSIKNLIAIRGNHDVWCYDWIMAGRSPMLWTEQGGVATINSYKRTLRYIDKDHRDFWQNQQDWYIDDQNRLFIHAGWDYMAPGSFEDQASMPVNAGSIAKECHWDRFIIQGAMSAFGLNGTKNGKFKTLEQFKEVYIGHTVLKDGPTFLGNLTNMDTGSGYGFELSIMNIDTKEVFKSDQARDLYPDEKGR